MWPENTADVTTLLPVIDRLRERLSIGRLCVVANRGVILAATIVGLEESKLEYPSSARASAPRGSRARSCSSTPIRSFPSNIERKAGAEQLFV